MLDDNTTDGVPPVPSVGRLGWLLFMQPVALGRMHVAWGFGRDPSPVTLWKRARAHDSIARGLLARYAFWLLVVMPLVAGLVGSALALAGVAVDASRVAVGVAAGVTVGWAGGMAGGVAIGVAVGAAGGVAAGVAGSVAVGASAVALAVAVGAAFGVGFGLAFAMANGVEFGVAVGAGVPVGAAFTFALGLGVVCSVGLGILFGMAFGVAGTAVFGMASGVDAGVAGGVAGSGTFIIAYLRLPLWIAEAVTTWLMSRRMRYRPGEAHRLASRLPFRHDDLIYLPLPGLRACLLDVAEVDTALARELITTAAASIGQRSVARRALIELQARDLERAARDRLWSRAAGLDLPFLPGEADLASNAGNAPIRVFQTAARDLIAGSTNQRQRQLALERARSGLESFRVTAIATKRWAPLVRRLWSTAALWLDVIHDEANKLAREVATHPEVPAAFIAGPPLTPARAEERPLFKGRADIIKVIEHDLAPDRRGVVVVVGQRRMGKTSLCNYLPTYLGTGTRVVVSNFQPLSGDAHRGSPHRRVLRDIAAQAPSAPPLPEAAHWGDGLAWLERLDPTCTDRKLLVAIDEIERVEDGIRDGWCSSDFLDFLRAAGDALQNVRFLLLTAYPLHRLGTHWTDRLVSATSRTISYLGEDDARELLAHPIADFPDIYPGGGIDLILAQTARHPYLLQKAGDDLCRLLNSRGGLRTATRDELTEVFDGMVRDVHLFDEIWGSRTHDEQATLRRLARSDEPGDVDPAAVQLVREGYLARTGDKVSITVPLFQEWIRMNLV